MSGQYSFISRFNDFYTRMGLFRGSTFELYFNRIVIDFTIGIKTGFKSWSSGMRNLFNLSYDDDFSDPEFGKILGEIIKELDGTLLAMHKIMRMDIANIAELGELRPEVFYIIKQLTSINVELLEKILSTYDNCRIPWLEIACFAREIYEPLLSVSHISWDPDERLKINTSFKTYSTCPDISNPILYALSVMTKFCRNKFSLDPGISSHLFARVTDGFNYLTEKAPYLLSPVFLRMIGFKLLAWKRDRRIIDAQLSQLFGVTVEMISEDVTAVIGEAEQKQREQAEAHENDDRIKVIPEEVKTSASIINNLLGLEFYQDQILYPDYVQAMMAVGFPELKRFTDISHLDAMNYAVVYIYLLSLLMTETVQIETNFPTLSDEMARVRKYLPEFLNDIEYRYIKEYRELARMYAEYKKPLEQELVRKSFDQLNLYKKSYIFPSFLYLHFTKMTVVDPNLTPLYDMLQQLESVMKNFLDEIDRRKTDDKKIQVIFPSAFNDIRFTNEKIAALFATAYPKTANYEPKIQINLMYVVYNLLQIGIWTLCSENSFFNNYPSTKFMEPDAPEAGEIRVVKSADYYLYNKLNVEVAKFKNLAYVDKLTGCYNKNFYETELPTLVSGGIIVYFDLDNFKHFNDVYSHDTGDEILKEFGKLLVRNCRKSDLPVRMGGDEFAVILKAQKMEMGIYYATRIYEGLANLNRYLSKMIGMKYGREVEKALGVSTGIVRFGTDIVTTVHNADATMYVGKRKGKNLIVTLDDEGKYQFFRPAPAEPTPETTGKKPVDNDRSEGAPLNEAPSDQESGVV